MDKKIKMLVLPSDRSGCGYFRSVSPHKWIAEHMSDIFDIDIMYGIPNDVNLETFLRKYDIIHIHKHLDKQCNIIKMAQFLDVKVIVDVDDNWNLGTWHPMSASANAERWDIPITDSLKLADMCSTTTEIFANQIRKINKKVEVFPNAIDTTEEQFIPKDTRDTDRIRIGMICGSSHLHDFKLLDGMVAKLDKEIIDQIQFVLCGFDTRGTRTIRYKDTGKVETVPIKPEESVWYEYEKIITNNYSIVSKEHKDFLMKFIPQSDYPNHDEAYRRCWTKDISQYATHYNNIDVLLVPLAENDFNKVKSQLKVVEAGFFHKAIIASDFGPYTIDLKSMITKGYEFHEDGNSLLIENGKGAKRWAKMITWLVQNKDKLKLLQDNLFKTVDGVYDIETVCKQRARKYIELVGRTDLKIE